MNKINPKSTTSFIGMVCTFLVMIGMNVLETETWPLYFSTRWHGTPNSCNCINRYITLFLVNGNIAKFFNFNDSNDRRSYLGPQNQQDIQVYNCLNDAEKRTIWTIQGCNKGENGENDNKRIMDILCVQMNLGHDRKEARKNIEQHENLWSFAQVVKIALKFI